MYMLTYTRRLIGLSSGSPICILYIYNVLYVYTHCMHAYIESERLVLNWFDLACMLTSESLRDLS
jgi:hypothetical protein